MFSPVLVIVTIPSFLSGKLREIEENCTVIATIRE